MKEISIAEASKVMAQYLGWEYIGFNSHPEMDSKLKLGWYAIQQQKLHPIILHTPKAGFTQIRENVWGKWKCRNHNELRFYNDWNWIYDLIYKIENEDLSEYNYKWTDDRGEHNNFSCIEVSVDSRYADVYMTYQLDPPECLSKTGYFDGKEKREKVFWMLYESIVKINEIKSKNPT